MGYQMDDVESALRGAGWHEGWGGYGGVDVFGHMVVVGLQLLGHEGGLGMPWVW